MCTATDSVDVYTVLLPASVNFVDVHTFLLPGSVDSVDIYTFQMLVLILDFK